VRKGTILAPYGRYRQIAGNRLHDTLLRLGQFMLRTALAGFAYADGKVRSLPGNRKLSGVCAEWFGKCQSSVKKWMPG